MQPILFSIGHIHAYGYGFMIALGALLAVFLSQWRANRRDLDGNLVFNAAVWGLFAGLFGAKLTYVVSNYKMLFTDPAAVLGTDGFTVYGGVVLGILVGILVLKRGGADVPLYMDLIIPQIALAQGFGRIGCYLAGCCYGAPTNSPLGVVFPVEAIAPSGISLWPTQLFSAAGDFLIFLILIVLSNTLKGRLKPLTISGLYLILYGIGRFIIEFFRADPRRMLLGLSSNQYVSFLFVIAGTALILYGAKRLAEK